MQMIRGTLNRRRRALVANVEIRGRNTTRGNRRQIPKLAHVDQAEIAVDEVIPGHRSGSRRFGRLSRRKVQIEKRATFLNLSSQRNDVMTRGEVAIGEELASLGKLDTRKRNIGIENVKRLGGVGLGLTRMGKVYNFNR